ncbi:CARDB domain-containing protein [Thermococcus sp.]|uniref:CARDB domain-containing protein n=1 Tax=Thermococcus sp. TaxID=35749 RepID=UPI00261CCC7B|nr:CARDB domain-containing protein [Thermococcus sp.]
MRTEFNGYEKHDEGSIIVEDDNGNTGSLKISSVSISPQKPEDGDSVSFTVKVKSTHLTSQNMELELYVDGNLVDGTQGVINANSEETFNLHWLALTGEHSYTVKAYSIVGGEKFMEDEKSGRVKVVKDLIANISMEIECPSRVGLGGSFECLLQVENDNSETIGVQLNNITFRSEVKREEDDINYVRFQRIEGVFYLSAFKEVPPHSSRSVPINLGRVDNDFASHFGLSDNHLLLSSTIQGDVNPNVLHQIAYWDTEYSITLRLDVFDENGSVLFKDKALTTSTTFFYYGSAQAKIDREMRIQRLENFGENTIKVIVVIVTVYYSKGNLGDKLWEFVKGFWG